MKYRILLGSAALLVAVGCTTNTVEDDGSSSGKGASGGTGSGNGGSGATGAGTPDPYANGVAVLGSKTNDVGSVNLRQISTANDGLNIPRDLQFNPTAMNELWVVNRADSSMVIYFDPDTPNQVASKRNGFGNTHFMAQPSALAFGLDGFMATAHEEHEQTQGPQGTPADFMGPTLWPANSDEFEAGHESHYDMLHNSPDGMGIAWRSGNDYWIFDGYHSSITQYDFRLDHGPGGADHSDGYVRRYVEGEVSRVADIPSHMVFNWDGNQLYVADTGNNRVAVMDVNTGVDGGFVSPNYDGSDQKMRDGAVITTLIDGNAEGWVLPSGIANFNNELLFVSDIETSTIYAYTMDGALVDFLPTGLPARSICGMEIDPDGDLWFTDTANNAVWRLSPIAGE